MINNLVLIIIVIKIKLYYTLKKKINKWNMHNSKTVVKKLQPKIKYYQLKLKMYVVMIFKNSIIHHINNIV